MSKEKIKIWLLKETYAIPVDIFRILSGFLLFSYFIFLLKDASVFSNPYGLLDHEFIRGLYWFTKISLYPAGMKLWMFYTLFSLGCVGSLAISCGWRSRTWAAILFLIVVCTYRWNFIVMYVDDSIMHLLCFWLILLPTGKTLTLKGWLKQKNEKIWEKWLFEKVPGVTIRFLLANMLLVYIVAGFWKFESPLWHNGFALYATLRLPIAWYPDFWQIKHIPLLKFFNYFSLLVEPLLVFFLPLRAYHPLKWAALFMMVGLHMGIIMTLRIPFANFAMLGSAVLFFRVELMDFLLRKQSVKPVLKSRIRFGLAGHAAWVLMFLLSLAMMRRLPIIGQVHKPAYVVLWVLGFAQDYQLFNWIDKKNFRAEHHVIAKKDGVEREEVVERIFPVSIRTMLFQSYLYDLRWINMPDWARKQFKRTSILKITKRYCELYPTRETITIWTDVIRIHPDNLDEKERKRHFLVSFFCQENKPIICGVADPNRVKKKYAPCKDTAHISL